MSTLDGTPSSTRQTVLVAEKFYLGASHKMPQVPFRMAIQIFGLGCLDQSQINGSLIGKVPIGV